MKTLSLFALTLLQACSVGNRDRDQGSGTLGTTSSGSATGPYYSIACEPEGLGDAGYTINGLLFEGGNGSITLSRIWIGGADTMAPANVQYAFKGRQLMISDNRMNVAVNVGGKLLPTIDSKTAFQGTFQGKGELASVQPANFGISCRFAYDANDKGPLRALLLVRTDLADPNNLVAKVETEIARLVGDGIVRSIAHDEMPQNRCVELEASIETGKLGEIQESLSLIASSPYRVYKVTEINYCPSNPAP